MVRPEREMHSSVWDLLGALRGPDPLKELFWSELNYQRVNEPISRQGWGKAAKVAAARNLWVPAVNNAGTWGRWAFIEITDPWDARKAIRRILARPASIGKGQ